MISGIFETRRRKADDDEGAERPIMKKALMTAGLINFYIQENSFLGREDIKVFTAATTDVMLKLHREEKVDLMVTTLDLPGTLTCEKLFDTIRRSEELRKVSIIIICEDTPVNSKRCRQCGANAVFTTPVDGALLHDRMRQLLDIAPRQAYRAMLQIAGVEGTLGDRAFLCHAENISATGMLISAQEVLPEGSPVYLSLFLPDGARVCAHGAVVRTARQMATSHAFRYGIRFTDISPEDVAAIEKFVKQETAGARSRND